MNLKGTWDLTIKTPIGSLAVEYHFTDDAGTLAGTATYKGETVALQDVTVQGTAVTWHQRVTKPMRLNLDFDVTVTGDHLHGHSRAGRLPRSEVSGRRQQPRPAPGRQQEA